MQNPVTQTNPTEDGTFDIDAIFAEPAPSTPPSLALPSNRPTQRFTFQGPRTALADRLTQIVDAASPADWWWSVEVSGSGSICLTACPDLKTDEIVGFIQLRGLEVVECWGRSKRAVISRGSAAIPCAALYRPAPGELVAVRDALEAALSAQEAA